jgi:hypothetical protein
MDREKAQPTAGARLALRKYPVMLQSWAYARDDKNKTSRILKDNFI